MDLGKLLMDETEPLRMWSRLGEMYGNSQSSLELDDLIRAARMDPRLPFVDFETRFSGLIRQYEK